MLVKNFVQNSRMDFGDERLQCSAKICSFEVVDRKASMSIEMWGASIGSGQRAIICAPRLARDSNNVRPVEVKPP